MNRSILFAILCLSLAGCKKDNNGDSPPVTEEKVLSIRAADISFLPEIEEAGTIFYDLNGVAKDVVSILQENGCNTIRIRLWHTPATKHSGLEEVVHLSNRVKAKEMKVWLDIHYSDTWADPGKQTKPTAWESVDATTLLDSVYNYTQKVVLRVNPEYVQVGNEINAGFLWPNGSTSNVSGFIALLKKGVLAVRENAPNAKIILHIAGYTQASWFFDMVRSQNVDYDFMGLSYYPAWHGKNLTELASVLNGISKTNKKPYVVAETAYPFTFNWNDWTNNLIGTSEHIMIEYPASATGQKDYLLKLKSIVATSFWGEGFCYWAPEWVAYKGSTATNGSPWENMCLFDFQNKALPGIEVFTQ